MDEVAQRKWDAAAARYDLFSRGPERRWGPVKKEFFSVMRGRVLFLAAGTGQDFQFFPPGQAITAIDISGQMLARARPRAQQYPGRLDLLQMNAHALAFADHSFDQVFTSCTFCSVPDPVLGLTELRRVLKPGGELRMFEHTGSRWFPFSLMLRLMNPVSRRFGPELIRNTPRNVQRAGFRIRQVSNVYLDVVKTIVATV
jgi:ubiquinone/menaquinone biosynthesis C-methylase UbiE